MSTQWERIFVSSESPTGRRNGAGFQPCQGLYYRPCDARPRVALIASHYNVDFSEHYLGPLVAERGLGFLGRNASAPKCWKNSGMDRPGRNWIRFIATVVPSEMHSDRGSGRGWLTT